MTEDKRLDQLFAAARNEGPGVSYSKTKSTFLKAIGLGIFGTLGMKWAELSTKLKTIIMLSSIGLGVLISTCIVHFSNTPQQTQNSEQKTLITENKEISVEADGSTKTVYYDDDTNIVHVVKTPAKTERLKRLEPLSTERISPETAEQKEIVQVPEKLTPADTVRKPAGRKTFVIMRNTSDLELEKIQQEAEKAGVHFRYSILVWKGKVKRCKFNLSLKTEKSDCSYTSELKGKFKKTIGWVTDENGQAIELITE